MSSSDAASKMSEDELITGLQTIGGPLLAELTRRGFDVRLDKRNSASGIPVFVATPRPKLVAE